MVQSETLTVVSVEDLCAECCYKAFKQHLAEVPGRFLCTAHGWVLDEGVWTNGCSFRNQEDLLFNRHTQRAAYGVEVL